MKNMKYAAIGIFLILAIIAIFDKKDTLDISRLDWTCNKGVCNVTFLAENRTQMIIKNDIRMRAYKKRRVVGSEAETNVLIGKKVISIQLGPEESREVKESLRLDMNTRVTALYVNAWNKK